MVIQPPDTSQTFMSSGYASVEMPLNDLSAFNVEYVGNLEYRFDTLFLGGSAHYIYNKSKQSLIPFLSVGLFFNKNVIGRFLYSPLNGSYKWEIDFEM